MILTNLLLRYARLKAWKLPTPFLFLVVYAEGYVNSATALDLIDTGQRSAISRKFIYKHNGLLITT